MHVSSPRMDQGIGMQEVWNPGALIRVLTGGYKRIESPVLGAGD
jgi:hypothetical protein